MPDRSFRYPDGPPFRSRWAYWKQVVTVVAVGIALTTAAQATEQSATTASSTASSIASSTASETTIEGGSIDGAPSSTVAQTTTPSTVGPPALPTTPGPEPTIAPDPSTTDLRDVDGGPTPLTDPVTVTQPAISFPTTTDGSPTTIDSTTTSSTTTSSTTTLKDGAQSTPVRCLFLTTGSGSDMVATAEAPSPAPCKKTDGTWAHGSDTLALGKLRSSGGRARSLSVWALVAQEEALRALRFSVRRPDGSTAVAQMTLIGRGVDQTPTCEPRPGLIQAIRSTGQFGNETDAGAMCSKPGLTFVELSFELAAQSPCGTYSAVAMTDEQLAKPLLMTFAISCVPQLTVEFDRLDLSNLPAGTTVLKGDQRTNGNEWIVRNTGDTPFDLQATFSPTSGESLSPNDTLLSASLRLKTEEIGKPVITLCPGQSAVLDILAIVAPSAPSGGFSSSLSFSMATRQGTSLCS